MLINTVSLIADIQYFMQYGSEGTQCSVLVPYVLYRVDVHVDPTSSLVLCSCSEYMSGMY